MEEILRHFSAKKRQFGHEIQPLIFDVNIQHIGPYRLSRPWVGNKIVFFPAMSNHFRSGRIMAD